MTEGRTPTPPEVAAAAGPKEPEQPEISQEIQEEIKSAEEALRAFLDEHASEDLSEEGRAELARDAARELYLDTPSFDARATIFPLLNQFEAMWNPKMQASWKERIARATQKLLGMRRFRNRPIDDDK